MAKVSCDLGWFGSTTNLLPVFAVQPQRDGASAGRQPRLRPPPRRWNRAHGAKGGRTGAQGHLHRRFAHLREESQLERHRILPRKPPSLPPRRFPRAPRSSHVGVRAQSPGRLDRPGSSGDLLPRRNSGRRLRLVEGLPRRADLRGSQEGVRAAGGASSGGVGVGSGRTSASGRSILPSHGRGRLRRRGERRRPSPLAKRYSQ